MSEDKIARKAAELGITVEDDNIFQGGSKIGWLYPGDNGRWFGCPLSTVGHAFPVGAMENLKEHGMGTRLGAALVFVQGDGMAMG